MNLGFILVIQHFMMSAESIYFQNVILNENIQSYTSVKHNPLNSDGWHTTNNGKSVQKRAVVM